MQADGHNNRNAGIISSGITVYTDTQSPTYNTHSHFHAYSVNITFLTVKDCKDATVSGNSTVTNFIRSNWTFHVISH